jgi:hypothetical protein
MIDDMTLHGLKPETIRAYVDGIARLARHFGKSPELLGTAEIRSSLLYLIRDRHVASSTSNQALCAGKSLYRIALRKVSESPWRRVFAAVGGMSQRARRSHSRRAVTEEGDLSRSRREFHRRGGERGRRLHASMQLLLYNPQSPPHPIYYPFSPLSSRTS